MSIAGAEGGLKGASVEFPAVSVGATENALMAATLANGETVLGNAAREPEIADLAECLIAMGAKIAGLGTSKITSKASIRFWRRSIACSPTASRPAPMRSPPPSPAAISNSWAPRPRW